jgi:hypothetical protein
VISTDVNSGAGTVTPPAVGVCSAGQVLMAPYAAFWPGTGLPVAAAATPFWLRGLAAGTTGSTARPSVTTTAQREFAVVGVPAGHTSSTPGDLPSGDPLS